METAAEPEEEHIWYQADGGGPIGFRRSPDSNDRVDGNQFPAAPPHSKWEALSVCQGDSDSADGWIQVIAYDEFLYLPTNYMDKICSPKQDEPEPEQLLGLATELEEMSQAEMIAQMKERKAAKLKGTEVSPMTQLKEATEELGRMVESADRVILHNKPGQSEEELAAEIKQRLSHAGAKDGPLQCSLMWEGSCDLDLHCITPTGAKIGYSKPESDGGSLDTLDREEGQPVENIVFADPPPGVYKFYVTSLGSEEGEEAAALPFVVRTIGGGEVHYLRFEIPDQTNLSEAEKDSLSETGETVWEYTHGPTQPAPNTAQPSPLGSPAGGSRSASSSLDQDSRGRSGSVFTEGASSVEAERTTSGRLAELEKARELQVGVANRVNRSPSL